MDILRQNIAKNITALRQASKMTQAELAQKLNYSDKAISKWERASSIPDVAVLKQIADLFHVSVDYLLENHSINEIEENISHRVRANNHLVISLLSGVLVWFIATMAFVCLNLILGSSAYLWLIYVFAVPATIIVLLVFNSLWGRARNNYALISVLTWTLLIAVYFLLLLFYASLKFRLIFLIGIPTQILIILWSRLKFRKKRPSSPQ